MRSLILLLLCPLALASVPAPRYTPPVRSVVDKLSRRHGNGRWYMAADGHAVFCYGPTRMIPDDNGGLKKIVTFCRGDRVIVDLKE